MEAMPVEADADGGRCRCRRADARPMPLAAGADPARASPRRAAAGRRRAAASASAAALRRRLRRPPPASASAAGARPRLPLRAAPAAGRHAAGAQPKLVVLRGQKRNAEYPIYEGLNFVGRADEKPVDIDLEDQEPPDRVWSSRQHACINFENGELSIEDLNSSNGTFVNRARIYPGTEEDR